MCVGKVRPLPAARGRGLHLQGLTFGRVWLCRAAAAAAAEREWQRAGRKSHRTIPPPLYLLFQTWYDFIRVKRTQVGRRRV